MTRRTAAFLFTAAALTSAVFGQNNMDKEGRRPSDENAAQQIAVQAADASRRKILTGPAPTYEQVLADPDNVPLNYRYALWQIQQGELRGASATLERVLMVDPNQPSTRLLHALVLYRLDNLSDAQREFAVLKAQNLAADLRATADAYDREIDRRLRKTWVTGRLALGFEEDSNRNSAPSTGQALFLGAPLQLTGSSLRRSDESMIAVAGFDVRHQLPGAGGHEVFADYNYFRQDERVVPTVDLQAHSLAAGANLRAEGYKITPSASFDHVDLSRETLLGDLGAGLTVSRKVAPGLELSVAGLGQYQDFHQTAAAGPMNERSGPLWDVGVGAQLDAGQSLRFNVGLDGVEKRAAKNYNAYRRYAPTGAVTWLIGKGFFLNGLAQVYYDRYYAPDALVSLKDRSDDIYRLRLALGGPLSAAGPLSALVATLSYEYYHALSNISNYSYDNGKVSAMMNYRWEAFR